MRAMTLAADDSGDEQQSEFKALQNELKVAVTAIQELSQQLNCLKEQVITIYFVHFIYLLNVIYFCIHY